ncbi:Hypothetical predicted protein [Lecanosticta acicola]|uniref:Uncharacterized protein n=1 Tax=Lecanosticta acicola TaxID=111012 RepID=A0AAI9EA04_9PEZI|nr:Hypothetical predicted protein [Lecanosticta acicola]
MDRRDRSAPPPASGNYNIAPPPFATSSSPPITHNSPPQQMPPPAAQRPLPSQPSAATGVPHPQYTPLQYQHRYHPSQPGYAGHLPQTFGHDSMPYGQHFNHHPPGYAPPYAPHPSYGQPYGYGQYPGYCLPPPHFSSQYFTSTSHFMGMGTTTQPVPSAPQPGHRWNPPLAQTPQYRVPAYGVDNERVLHLYGRRLPPVSVSGDFVAILQLQKAIDSNGLMVQEGLPEANTHAVRVSALYHEQTGALPDIEHDANFRLHQLSPEELQQFGITEKEIDDRCPGVSQHAGSPPFKEPLVDRALTFLNTLGKYHHHGKLGGPRVWQVCVTTNSRGSHRFQHYKAAGTTAPTHTFHLFREIVGRGHDYTERWKGFVLGPGAPIPVRERVEYPPSTSRGHQRIQATEAEFQNAEEESEDDDSADHATPTPTTSTTASKTNSSMSPSLSTIKIQSPGLLLTRKLHHFDGISCPARDTRARFPAHLSDSALLTGLVHPEDICGTLLLDLAARNSNKRIANHVLALYQALPGTRNKAMNANGITKRITLALQARAAREGRGYECVKAAFDAERKRNGAFAKEEARLGVRDRIPSMLGVVKRRRERREKTGESEDEDDGTPVPVPGKRARKSRAAVKTESEDEMEEELRDLDEMQMKSQRSGQKKRKFLVKQEEDDDDDEEDDEEDGLEPATKKTRRTAVVETDVEAPRTLRSRKSRVSYCAAAAMADLDDDEEEEEEEVKAENFSEMGAEEDREAAAASKFLKAFEEGHDSDESEFEGSDDDDEGEDDDDD